VGVCVYHRFLATFLRCLATFLRCLATFLRCYERDHGFCKRGHRLSRLGRIAGVIGAALTMAGCAVGPDFNSPSPPSVTSLTPEPLPVSQISAPERQAFVESLQIPKKWWELLHCGPLNAITARAIEGNTDLEAAHAALRIANANTEAARGGFFPQVGASFGASVQKPSAAQVPVGASTSPYSLSSGQLSVSYVADVFGLNRRTVEALAAQAEVQYFEAEATYLTLTSKIALAAVQEAALREQIQAAETSVSVGTEVLTLLKKQLDANEATRTDVATQEAALSQFKQQLETLKKQLATNRDLMIALTGAFAGEGLAEKFDFVCLQLPANLPRSLPSAIVRNRPDIRAAEADMHAATAQIGVAIANRLPQFTLTSNAGASAAAISKLASLSSPLLLWSIAGNAAATLFDGMSLEQKQRAAEAGLDRSAALYRGTVVSAFQNVADVLQAIEADRRLFISAERGEKAAKLNLDLTRKLLTQSQANMLQVLSAQQLFAQAASAKAQARAARLSDTVMLFQALGGGWQARAEAEKFARTGESAVSVE
jgi:NodT family efflux transporter outer membrane factor (OMF) lipoprotein